MKTEVSDLNKKECAALRGLAILAIVLHNYCHFFAFTIKENEYTFHSYYNHYFWNHVFHLNSDLFFDVFSFLGHYGVPVFLFISGYGLVTKYESQKTSPSVVPFVKYHYLKLLRLMFMGFTCFIFVDWYLKSEFRFTLTDIIAQIAMIINLFPTPDVIIKPGPYWYFGLMLEMYLVYIVFFHRRHWTMILAAIVICWLVQALCNPTGETLNWLRYNFIGAVLPFGSGILYARYLKWELNRSTYFAIGTVAVLLICLFGGNYQLWLWIPLFVIIASVAFVKILPRIVIKPFAWIGSISAMIFVVHPILRPVILNIFNESYLYTGLALYVVSTLAIAYLYQKILMYIPKPKMK
jgi:peptidoglycan/LPS O-acetylase OafA/YrhL